MMHEEIHRNTVPITMRVLLWVSLDKIAVSWRAVPKSHTLGFPSSSINMLSGSEKIINTLCDVTILLYICSVRDYYLI